MTRPARLLLWLVVAVAVVALLFFVVFPWVDRTFVTDPTLEATRGSAGALV